MQTQTLDQIFSSKTPGVSTPRPVVNQTANQPSKSLESIFGSQTEQKKPSLDSIFNAKPIPQPTPTYGAEVGQQQVAGAQKINKSINQAVQAGPDIAKQVSEGKPLQAAGTALKGTAQAAFGGITGATQVALAPITPAISKAVSAITPELRRENPALAEAYDYVAPKIADLSAKHPEASELTSDIINTLLLAVGGPKVAPALKTGGEALGEVATPLVKGAITKGNEVVAGAKNMVKPEPVESTIGKVLQGGESDISKGKKGLSLIDTSKVKTYKDLQSVSDKTVKNTLKEQDTIYAKDTTPKKVQQLAIKVGDTPAAHNYVIDAANQLKEYYGKVNDVAKLNKINGYIAKLDPTKGKGLTLNEISDISRMHGSDLNAYNTNGELASGLSKQAAENTRQGVKTTLGNLSPEGRAIDEKLSSLITVRDLSKDMADKVTTLTQRLQKPNILQKLGGTIGRATRITGVGDFAQKLLGFEKVPGATTLNAVELEAKLSKNLKKINEALSKDDSGFVNDISKMIEEIKSIPNKEGGFISAGESNPLIQEAKKYKSAEEFVKAQPKAYHFTSPETKITKWSTKNSMGRIWFTDNPKVEGNVGASGKGKMYEVVMDKNAKWATPAQADKSYTDQLIAEGYDGVYHPDSSGEYGNYYEVFNPKVIQTKSQLTDIWKKANQ